MNSRLAAFLTAGGFPLGGMLAGITPLWASEIEPFAVRVTTKRLPRMKHYGDVSSLNGADLPPVDIITFGSPCQDMSIAGKRSGLDGSRSSLFYEAVRIPIIGMGGVTRAEDVLELMLAGATAVEVGAANLVNPYACRDIVRDLPQAMQNYNIQNLKDIIGGAHHG